MKSSANVTKYAFLDIKTTVLSDYNIFSAFSIKRVKDGADGQTRQQHLSPIVFGISPLCFLQIHKK
jgi:hypothetical protein